MSGPNQQEHICLGISPFNSLFSEDYITSLVKFAQENFQNFHLFIPDEPTIYTLLALGYDMPKAKKKMKKQINWLNNKVKKSLLRCGVDEGSLSNHILNFRALEPNPEYQRELELVFDLYEKDQDFRNACLGTSNWVLQGHLKGEDISQDRLEIAVKYFLYELPLFAATSKIVNCSSSLFCYHQSTRFHELLYAKEMAYRPASGQSYGVISSKLVTDGVLREKASA